MAQLFSRNGRWMTIEQVKDFEKVEKQVPHTGVYFCPKCEKATKSQWHLDKHMKSHK